MFSTVAPRYDFITRAFSYGMDGRWKRTLVETAALASQQLLVFEPGTRWLYSNVGMATLGRIIEIVSGQPYEQFISERILAPLGMQDTFYFPSAGKQKRIAAVYTDDNGKLKREDIDLFRRGVLGRH